MSREIILSTSTGNPIIRCVCYTQFSAFDAFTVSRTHERFRHLAQYTYVPYPKSVELVLKDVNFGNQFSILENELAKYGSLVNEITYFGCSLTSRSYGFLEFVKANYRRWNLKCLRFVHAGFDIDRIKKNGIIFEKLESIELNSCTDDFTGAFEAILLRCKRLKELTLIDLDDFDGSFMSTVTSQLESLYWQNSENSNNSNSICVLKIGSQTKSLILRHVSVVIECPSKNLSNLHTLKLCLIRSRAPTELFAYTGNQLKHLHLANTNSDGNQIRAIGNQLETFSLLKCPNFCIQHIYKLLANNKNLRSVKLCNVGNESMFEEVPKIIQNVEELCIWPSTENNRQPINFNEIVKLPRLKSFTFLSPKYTDQLDILTKLMEQLIGVDTLECLGFLMRPKDLKKTKFNEKFFQLKNLKSLKLVVWGPQALNQKVAVEIATNFTELNELKLLNTNDIDRKLELFHDACCCQILKKLNKRFPMKISVNQFVQILRARKAAKAKTPLMVYQMHGPHNETARMLSNQIDANKNVLQVLPLDSDAFFNFFNANSTHQSI